MGGGNKKRKRRPGGLAELLGISAPLMLTMAAITVNTFMDRLFLTWYSPAAGAASFPGAMLSWTLIGVPMGIAAYINTFVAQYHGAGHPERIGPAVWQSIWFSLAVSPFLLIAIPFAEPIFRFAGHEPALCYQESIYFQILVLGSGANILAAAVSSFFTGRGRTWVVLIVDIAGVAVNCLFNFALIFGSRGLADLAEKGADLAPFFLRVLNFFHLTAPELGIRGAALATVVAMCFRVVVYMTLFLLPIFRKKYATLNFHFDREIAWRLVKYGTPSGLTTVVDAAAFTIFLLLIGQLGEQVMLATNLAFSVNSLAFMPIAGLQVGVTTLVGRWIGRREPAIASKVTWNGQRLSFCYMGCLAIGYATIPEFFMGPFKSGMDPQAFAEVFGQVSFYMKFMAVYAIFDGISMVFSGTLRGAGDTRFVFFTIAIVSFSSVFICWFGLKRGVDASFCWGVLTAWVIVFAMTFAWRFFRGKWKKMRVIET